MADALVITTLDPLGRTAHYMLALADDLREQHTARIGDLAFLTLIRLA